MRLTNAGKTAAPHWTSLRIKPAVEWLSIWKGSIGEELQPGLFDVLV
jgi:hypothetical protein